MSGRDVDKQAVEEVERIVAERGALTKDEVCELLGFDDETFGALRATLLTRGRVQTGPRRVGGFVARSTRPKRPEEGAGATDPLRQAEPWERATAERLCALLSLKQLEELLGALRFTVRGARRWREGQDRPLRKDEAASALIVQHGLDLLAEPAVRAAVGHACRVDVPGRWHPGKRAALEFTAAVALPRELAGQPREEGRPSFEYLEGRFRLLELHDFQKEVRRKLEAGLHAHGYRAIVTLPTGAGKTRVAVEALRDWLAARRDPERAALRRAAVLWLAHTEELCEQACACFRQVWQASDDVTPLALVRFWGGYAQDLDEHHATLARVLEGPCVLVSTPQRVVNLLAGGQPQAASVADDLRRALGALMIDEAHRAAAPSYRRVIEGLCSARDTPVVGLTATPFRREYDDLDPEAGTRELRAIFGALIEPSLSLGARPRVTLQTRGVLAEPHFETIVTRTPMRLPEIEAEVASQEDVERIDRALALRADNARRRLLIFERLARLAEDPQHLILYFGPSVHDAECMAFLLRERDVPAAVVSGATREATRRRAIERFKRRELRVLCNCEVLTTGFDAPKVTHVVMARPTVSQVLYEQMVGRGLRGEEFGGTKTCTILDCEDDYGARPPRPELGYQRFRRVWQAETRAAPA